MRFTRIIALIIVLVVLFATGFGLGRQGAPQKPPPYKCYEIANGTKAGIDVWLETQFELALITVYRAEFFCTPVAKELPKGKKPFPVRKGDHLQCYELDAVSIPREDRILTDQFGQRPGVRIESAVYLCERTDKMLVAEP